MEKKRVVPVWASVILMVLCIASIALNVALIVHLIGDKHVGYKAVFIIDVVLFILASVLAAIYCITGYKKKFNKVFKVCSIVFTAAMFVQILNFLLPASTFSIADAAQPADAASGHAVAEGLQFIYSEFFPTVLSAISFACMLVLTAAENLGKVKSGIFSGIVAVCSLVTWLTYLDSPTAFILNVNFGALVYAIIYCFIVYAKYKDKAARGTK